MGDQAEQLKSVYAQMMDGELLNIASDMDSLTDVARPLLIAEMSRRGLDLAEDAPVDPIVLTEVESLDDEDRFMPIPDYDGKCPQCGSVDIVFLKRESPSEIEPDLQETFHWICAACENEWVDNGLEAQ